MLSWQLGAEGQRALPRRLEAVAAAQLAAARRRRRGRGRGGRDAARAQPPAQRAAAGRRADRRAHRRAGGARAREAAQPPQGLHPEGDRRRPQGLSAHRRIRRRPARRDLHRHAQGRRRLPRADEQLRHRHLARPAIRRAARGICRGLHLHPLRAGRHGRRATTRSRTRPRSSTTSSASSPISYLGRNDLAHVDPDDIGATAIGEGVDQGKAAPPPEAAVSHGLVRGKRLALVDRGSRGARRPAARPRRRWRRAAPPSPRKR